MRKCIEKLAQVPFREVSLGYRIVTLFDENNINKGQIGYSRTSEGDDLTGTEPGDWRSSWLVIGYDDRTGNPIFIDTSKSAFPVLIAVQGEKYWNPKLIATSLDGFIQGLLVIHDISEGRKIPSEIDSNPIPADIASDLLDRISVLTNTDDLSFWESWIEAV